MTVVDLFFFDMFSTISTFLIFLKKVVGPEASESILGRPWGFGRASWGIFGPSEGVRQGILGPPEGSGGHLGRVLGGLGAILERLFEQFSF